MTFKMRYVAPAVIGLASAISFVNVTLLLIFDPPPATPWGQVIVVCVIFGMVVFAIAMWACVGAIAKGRRIE